MSDFKIGPGGPIGSSGIERKTAKKSSSSTAANSAHVPSDSSALHSLEHANPSSIQEFAVHGRPDYEPKHPQAKADADILKGLLPPSAQAKFNRKIDAYHAEKLPTSLVHALA